MYMGGMPRKHGIQNQDLNILEFLNIFHFVTLYI